MKILKKIELMADIWNLWFILSFSRMFSYFYFNLELSKLIWLTQK